MWPYNSGYTGFGGFGGFTGGGGLPPIGGGPVSDPGFLGGLGDFVGDIADIVGDVSEVIEIIRGGGGGGTPATGSGTPFPTSSGNPFSNLVGSVGGGNSDVLANSLGNQSPQEAQFIDFLRAIGVGVSILTWLWDNPPITWPKIAKDAMAAWFNNGTPAQADSVVAPLVPTEWKTGGSTVPPTIPQTTGGSLPSFAGVLPMALPAVATQVYKAPKGYVTVNVPTGTGQSQKMFVQKRVASAMGLYKARKKAPITGKQYHAIKQAKRWETKLAKMMGDSCNYKVTKKR